MQPPTSGAASTSSPDGTDVASRIVAALAAGAHVQVVLGEPGIGKSTVLADIRTRLSAGGHRTVAISGREAERHVPLAALASLALVLTVPGDGDRGLLDAVADGAGGTTVALGLLLLDRLHDLVDDGPLLVCIDDAQWLDEVSAEVIAFALRRTEPTIDALLAVRTGEPHPFGDLPITHLHGVDLVTAARLLRGDGAAVDAEVVAAVSAACGANPLALRELGRVLTNAQRAGTERLPDPLPVGPHLRAALGRRLTGLSADTRHALAVLATAGELDPTTFEELLARVGSGTSTDALATAEAAGIVERVEGIVRFTHPLLRSVAATSATPAERRSVHRALADVLPPGSDRRAWHLADAAEGPDPAAERELRALAQRAGHRGAHLLAALAAVRAADVATTPAGAADLLRAAGESYWNLARPDRALPVLERALRADLDPGGHAEIRTTRAHVQAWTSSTARAVDELVDVGRGIESTRPAAASVAYVSAAVYAAMAGDAHRGATLARLADRVTASADEMTAFGVRAMGAFVRLCHGEADQIVDELAQLDVVCDLVGPDAPRELFEIAQLGGFGQIMQERWADATRTLAALAEAARRAALDGIANFAHAMLAEIGIRTGHWPRARAEALVDASHAGNKSAIVGTFGHASLARVDALLGLTESARTMADVARQQAHRSGMAMLEAWARHALGLADLVDGATTEALDHFAWIADLTRRAGYGDPGPLWWQGDYVEALLAAGRLDEARRFARELAATNRTARRAYARAIVGRTLALVDGDLVAAADSVAQLDALGAPFEAARSRLAQAALVRPEEGVVVLEAARSTFEQLGAAPWERRARQALSRLGAAPHPPTMLNIAALLSPAEARVALTVARGRTNAETARELYLGVKTVETHLSSAYRKLGVRTRTELAMLLARELDAAPPPVA